MCKEKLKKKMILECLHEIVYGLWLSLVELSSFTGRSSIECSKTSISGCEVAKRENWIAKLSRNKNKDEDPSRQRPPHE